MNILLVSDSYPPEIRSASYLMKELAGELARRGHSVEVVTSYPRYNLDEKDKTTVFPESRLEKGIRVIRARTLTHKKVNYFVRGISYLLFPGVFMRAVTRHVRGPVDVVIVYSPPLTLAKVGALIKKRWNARFILNVQDIFPQNAVDMKILNNRLLIGLFERIEKQAYADADTVVVHSEGNREFLITRKAVPADKIEVVHNWIDIAEVRGGTQTKRFRSDYGLENRFIVLFGGVMGPAQGLDSVLYSARNLLHIPDIAFLFLGDGTEKKRLIRMCAELDLRNVVLKPFIAQSEYAGLLREVDVGLVCLSARNKTPVVPAKILDYMAAAVPVVAFLNAESDGHGIIRDARCGYSCVSGDVDQMTSILKKVYEERNSFKKLGLSGYTYACHHFRKEICVDKLTCCFDTARRRNGEALCAHVPG